MQGQDWTPVTLTKRTGGGGGGGGGAAGGVRAKQDTTGRQMAKLEEDTEHFSHAAVGLDLARAIQQARMAKGLKQAELAAMIAEKSTVINEYESGRAIPNPTLISKLERALGARLPRPAKKK